MIELQRYVRVGRQRGAVVRRRGESQMVPDKPREEYGEVCDVLIRLVDEGTEVFRLTKAVQLGPERFQLRGAVPPGEKWEFQPGEVVRCIIKVLSQNEAHWLAVQHLLADQPAPADRPPE